MSTATSEVFFNKKPSSNEIILSASTWQYIGSGTYNKVYKSTTQLCLYINDQYIIDYWVFKKPKNSGIALEDPSPVNDKDRAIRIWNEIYPLKPAISYKKGWLLPYLGNIQPTDRQITNEIINIYKKTRRIVADGCGKGNFKLVNDKAYCVDVDIALRRGSISSDSFIEDIHPLSHKSDFLVYWLYFTNNNGKQTVATIKTLLYLEQQVAAIDIKDQHINYDLIEYLHRHRLGKLSIDKDILDELNTKTEVEISKMEPGVTIEYSL